MGTAARSPSSTCFPVLHLSYKAILAVMIRILLFIVCLLLKLGVLWASWDERFQLSTYCSCLLLFSLRLFTNRGVKVDSEQVLLRLIYLPGIYPCCYIVLRCEQGKPCTQSELCLSGLPIPANHQVIYFQFIRPKLPLAVGSL